MSIPIIDLAPHVQLKNNILYAQRQNDVLQAIMTRVQGLPNYIQYKNCLETLLFACNICEALVTKADNIDKQAVVVLAFTQLFNLNDIEVETLKLSINFLSNHNRIKTFSKVFFYLNKALKCLGLKSSP